MTQDLPSSHGQRDSSHPTFPLTATLRIRSLHKLEDDSTKVGWTVGEAKVEVYLCVEGERTGIGDHVRE